MSMPGFTADAAVHNAGARYQMVSSPAQSFDAVQPAQSHVFGGSESATLNTPLIRWRPRQCICVQWVQDCFLDYITGRYLCLAPRCKFRICNY